MTLSIKDNFAEKKEEFLKETRQKDQEGNRLVVNSEANGRFHSDWLSMIYPRLKLARNLLSDSGVIFISIDDGEAHALKKMSDEVFGEGNFVANLVWQKKFARANDATYFSTMHDHIFCYAKNSKLNGRDETYWELELLPRGDEIPSGYSNLDNDPRGDWTSVVLSAKSGTEKLKYEIETPSGRICQPPDGRYWAVNKEKFCELVSDNRIWFGKSGDGIPRLKTFLSEVQDGLRPNTIWFHKEVGHNQEGRQEVKSLFDDKAFFDSPKPVRLLKTVASLTPKSSEFIALDFFAGSATTAHAIMEKNSEDGGNRKFIMVQLPEPCDEKHEAFKAGYKTIAEISKERIRRSGQQILEGNCHPDWNKDVGFRVLKIDTSNMADVYYTPEATKQSDLLAAVDNIKPGRDNPEDLLFQVLVDWGVDLTLPVRRETIQGKTIFFVNHEPYDLIACFDEGITEELVKELATYKPLRVVFRDNGFASDAVKINVDQIFRQLSSATDVKSI